MAISRMLFASVIGVMFLSVKLVRTAPPDTNPATTEGQQDLRDAIDAIAVAAGLPQSMIDAAEGG